MSNPVAAGSIKFDPEMSGCLRVTEFQPFIDKIYREF
jgi:hypothetical protein